MILTRFGHSFKFTSASRRSSSSAPFFLARTTIMNTDDFIQSSEHEDSSSESELSEEELSSVSIPIHVHESIVSRINALWTLVENFPNIPREQQNAWSRSVSRVKSSLPSFKFALVGKTGCGKSTLINCLLGSSILPASAAVCGLACTSAITEIFYDDCDEIKGTIVFIDKDEWRKDLKHLLEDINEGEEDPSDSPADRSRERLFMVYPQLRGTELTTLTPSILLQTDPVSNKLGKSFTLESSADTDNFRAILEEYLSSSGNPNRPALWPLVRRIEIRGRFSVLSSGVTLVDLPGHGYFSCKQITSKHLTDAKRAQDDRDTLAYLKKWLMRFLMDDISVEQGIVMVVTGTDMSMMDNDIKLDQDDQLKFDSVSKACEVKELRSTMRLKKSKSKSKSQREARHLIHLDKARIRSVKGAIHDFFSKFYSGLAPYENGIPHLPLFCVGTWYVCVHKKKKTLLCYAQKSKTEIPKLKLHLRTTGDRRRVSWASRLLDHADALSDDIQSYFSEGRHPGRLNLDNKNKALALISKLEESNLSEAGDAFDAIEEEFQRVEDELDKAVAKAAKNAPRAMKEFASLHFSTYKAIMRGNGLYYDHDVNRALTRDILPAIQGSWIGGINHKIPLILKEATAVHSIWFIFRITLTDILAEIRRKHFGRHQKHDRGSECTGHCSRATHNYRRSIICR
ncbi:hypothetical protein C8R43DRAFT_998405 [Mycena crocata]|nr:hypothetical protein C8R43DRAFT_998405 [Mycena crocata]